MRSPCRQGRHSSSSSIILKSKGFGNSGRLERAPGAAGLPAAQDLQRPPSGRVANIAVTGDFEGDGRPGPFGNGTASQNIDYILLSPELFDRVTRAGVFRKGVWGGVNDPLRALPRDDRGDPRRFRSRRALRRPRHLTAPTGSSSSDRTDVLHQHPSADRSSFRSHAPAEYLLGALARLPGADK